jgi:ADP-ribosylglycohydrolase
MLQECIAFTGDVDTVAAVAMGSASMSRQIVHDLPSLLVAQLEDGAYGRKYIDELDEKLLVKFGFRAP